MKQAMVDFFNLIFGFRKLIAWLGVFSVAVVFRLKGLMDGGQMVDLLKNTFLAFVAANSTEHLLTTVKTYLTSKGQPALANAIPAPTTLPPNDNLIQADEQETK